jgi:hypothetical protein
MVKGKDHNFLNLLVSASELASMGWRKAPGKKMADGAGHTLPEN